MPMEKKSRPITATYTPLGIFQWKVNVMGLKNASTQFQRMMNDFLEPVNDVADCYVDDIIVGTQVPPGGTCINNITMTSAESCKF